MVFTAKSIKQLMFEAGMCTLVRYDQIIPTDYSGCPLSWIEPFLFIHPPKTLKGIPPKTDIWTQFVKQQYTSYKKVIKKVNTRRKICGHQEIGDRVIGMALENAFYHGNKNDPFLPVHLRVFEGKRGVIVSIRDCGNGFDYISKIFTLKHLKKKDLFFDKNLDQLVSKERYYLRRGRGFVSYLFSVAKIGFDDGGSTINILYPD